MKKILLTIAFTFVSIASYAQLVQASSLVVPRNIKYFGTMELYGAFNGQGHMGVQTVHGIQFNQHLYLGIGAGIGAYGQYSKSIYDGYNSFDEFFNANVNKGTDWEANINSEHYSEFQEFQSSRYDKYLEIPVFLHFSCEFMKTKCQPYVSANIGYRLEYYTMFVQPTAGIKINLPTGGLRLGIGVDFETDGDYYPTKFAFNIAYLF